MTETGIVATDEQQEIIQLITETMDECGIEYHQGKDGIVFYGLSHDDVRRNNYE